LESARWRLSGWEARSTRSHSKRDNGKKTKGARNSLGITLTFESIRQQAVVKVDHGLLVRRRAQLFRSEQTRSLPSFMLGDALCPHIDATAAGDRRSTSTCRLGPAVHQEEYQ